MHLPALRLLSQELVYVHSSPMFIPSNFMEVIVAMLLLSILNLHDSAFLRLF